MNHVILIGNIGRDPESATTQNGTPTVKLSLATNRKVKGENVTLWHNVKAFGKTAELIRDYTKKGDKIAIQGRIEYWQTERDGVTKYFTDIVATSVEFVHSRKTTEERRADFLDNSKANTASEFDDGLPF